MKKLTYEQLTNISEELLNDCIECEASEDNKRFFHAILLVIATFMMRYQEELEKK